MSAYPLEVPGRAVALTEHPYDRHHELREDDDWLDGVWSDPATRVLVVAGRRFEARDGALVWVSPEQVPEGIRVLLGERDGVVSFALVTGAEEAGEGWIDLRTGAATLGAGDAAYAVHAVGIAEWLDAVRHCPRCGGELRVTRAGHQQECTVCGRHQFPRTDPAVIMLVRDEQDRALLGRQTVWPEGRWSTLAGFVEPGESLEMAVRREVYEEVGVAVGRVDYLGSQPWPMPASLMVGFTAAATSHDIVVDEIEIAEARWFTRAEVLAGAEDGSVWLPGATSISRLLIEEWYGASLPGQW